MNQHDWVITTLPTEMLDGTREWGAMLVCDFGYQTGVEAQFATEAAALAAVEREAKWSPGHGMFA